MHSSRKQNHVQQHIQLKAWRRAFYFSHSVQWNYICVTLHFVCLHVSDDFGQLAGWKHLTSSVAQMVKQRGRYESGVCLKAGEDGEESCAWKGKDKRLLRRHLQRLKPAAPICQKISSKGCLAQLRLWRLWQITAARWKSWPEEDDVLK